MATGDQNVEATIRLKDEASSGIKEVAKSVDGLKKSVGDSSSALKSNAAAAAESTAAHESMAASVFKGVAAWDILKEGVHMFTDFLKGSVEAYLDAQKKMDLVRATVESMGKSWETARGPIEAFGATMVKLGVDDEQAMLSATKLAKAVGGDIPKGMQLAKLASDLTASGFGDLESNTSNLTSILAGRGTVALRQYKVQLEANATTAEILDAVQKKVTQTTEQYAQTIPGQLAVVQAGYDNLKEEVGGAFVAALYSATKGADATATAQSGMTQAGQILSIAVYETVQGFLALYDVLKIIGTRIAQVGALFDGLGKALKGDFAGAAAEIGSAAQIADSAMGDLGRTLDNMMHPSRALAAANEALANSHKTVQKTAFDAGEGVGNVQKQAKAAAPQLVSLADRTKELGDAFTALKDGATTDLASLADANAEDMKKISDDIGKTEDDISKLGQSFNRAAADDTKSVAEQIVASQMKVADIKTQLSAATTDQQKADLQKQLDAEQKNLDSASGFIRDHQAEIDAAKARASETDLQRAIDDYNARRALATQEYQAQLADLQKQLADQRKQRDDIKKLYTDRVTAITQMEADATAKYLELSALRVKTTSEEVAKEVKLFTDLASAISQVKSASTSALSTVSSSSKANVSGARAAGGPVSAGSAYIVGEHGPEIIEPNEAGYVNTTEQSINGGSIHITITGNTFMGKEGIAEMIGAEIMNQLKLQGKIS